MKHKYLAERYQKDITTDMGKATDQIHAYDDVVNLSLGDPDLNTDERIIEAVFSDVKNGYTHYTDTLGDAQLLEAIRDEYKKVFNYDVKQGECMVTTSGCHAMWLIMEAILNDGDEVIVPQPYFTPYPQQIALARGKAVFVETLEEENFELNIERLKQAITSKTKAIILNTPNNPTGRCTSLLKMKQIGEVAKQYDLIIVADHIYTLYSYQEEFIPITSLPGMRERTISIRSFSKDYCMSGWRIGYVLAPDYIIDTMRNINENNVFTAPSASQRAAYHALKLKDEIQPNIKKIFYERSQYAYERIQKISYLSVSKPQGSIYLFVNIKKSKDTSKVFCEKLFLKYHILAIPGTAFGESGEGYIRIAMREPIEVLKKVFDQLEQDEEWNI